MLVTEANPNVVGRIGAPSSGGKLAFVITAKQDRFRFTLSLACSRAMMRP